MVKGRRCYCNRLYPGFQCAYCRVGDYLADREQKLDPLREARKEPPPPPPKGWWSRMTSALRGADKQ